uniref:Protein kinase domain-containing protein n=1 Tax=Meloidogyne enterolobii TaxID=390850 RepID=A0A6V7UXX6_MELEN|nr:unnamed protein product [Meloidogyne enterolobii]
MDIHLLIFLLVVNLILLNSSVADYTDSESSDDEQSSQFRCRHGREFDQNVTTQVGTIELNTNTKHRIGDGGFGNTYHAYWPNGNRCVALKISNMETTKRRNAVINEVRILQQFSDWNESQSRIIKIYGYEEDKDTENMYTVMELGGKSLANYFHEKKKNIHNHDYFLVKNILQAAALAIKQLLHDSNGIHLDIKADNFIIALKEGQLQMQTNPLKCKLIDFNTSVFLGNERDADLSSTTKDFMAPEIRGNNNSNISQKVDIWAFGLMGYELLHKELPKYSSWFKYKDIDKVLKKYRKNNEHNTDLDNIIKDCINKDPDYRPTIDDILNRL